MKRQNPKPAKTPAKTERKADQTLHIEWPWSMTWMEYVDGMLDFLKSQIGPGHPLYRKKLYVSTVNRDRHTSETPWLDAVTLAADRHLTAG